MLVAAHISKSFGTKTVLSDVNLQIEAGKITVLFGESGCGKTTLLRILARLDPADNGIVRISEAEGKNDSPLYPRLTVVFQQLFLWPHLTNRENILLPLKKRNGALEKGMEYFNRLVGELEMSEYVDKFPNQSSMGQRQRVAIARALLLFPRYILMDEITASLDNIQAGKIINIIKDFRNDRNIGVLFITHNLDIAKRIGDNFAFLSEGVILESGTAELLSHPRTNQLKRYLNW